MPTRAPLLGPKIDTVYAKNYLPLNNLNNSGYFSSVPSLSNMLWQPLQQSMQAVINNYGRFNNLRC